MQRSDWTATIRNGHENALNPHSEFICMAPQCSERASGLELRRDSKWKPMNSFKTCSKAKQSRQRARDHESDWNANQHPPLNQQPLFLYMSYQSDLLIGFSFPSRLPASAPPGTGTVTVSPHKTSLLLIRAFGANPARLLLAEIHAHASNNPTLPCPALPSPVRPLLRTEAQRLVQ